MCRSSFKESFELRKNIPKSTSHGSFGVHAKYNRHSYTPNVSRSPQHFHRPGEVKSQSSYHLCKDINLPLLTFSLFYFPYLLYVHNSSFHLLLSWNNKQDRCFLPLYSLAPMLVNAPLPLYVTTFSLTPKVRTPACSSIPLFCIPSPVLALLSYIVITFPIYSIANPQFYVLNCEGLW